MKKAMTFLFLLAALLSTAGCASDDAAQDKDNPTAGATAFTMVDEAPAPQSAKSRTAGEYTGSKVKFYWTENDHLWLNTGADVIESHHSDIGDQLAAGGGTITKVPTATFYFHGTYTDPSYILRYTGKNGTKDKVTIAAVQIQKLPLEATQIGECGDCGIATATKNGDHYDFTLRHKAAYFTLTPFSSDSKLVGGKLTKIKITADKPLAGTFNFGDAGLDIATAPAGPSQSITLNLQGTDGKGFTLPATATPADNSATFVLPPNTYNTFDIEYTMTHPISHIPGTVTVNYTAKDFHAGANKKFAPDVKDVVFPVRYLFSDGTTGTLAEAGGRTPIGVVVIEKTAGTEGTAIALTDATTPATHQAWGKLGVSLQLLNTTQSTDFNTQLADIDGYHWTYDASGSQDGTVKANNSNLGSFYTAANYNSTTPPAFSGERLGKWYLPSLGEWALALKSLAKVTYFPTTMEEYGGSSLPTTRGKFDWTALNTVFTAVGGTALEDYWYWASGEYNGQQATVVCFDRSPANNIFTFGTDEKNYIGCCVRAFIHF